ncbi:TonB-dependent receptor plug domain-containing protein, partial [Acidobacteriota bacterium]
NFRLVPFLFFVFLYFFQPLEITLQEKKKPVQKGQVRIITEEIVVEANSPGGSQISSVATIQGKKVERVASRDLSDVFSFASGTFVSSGAKSESRLSIRGMDNQRITLLYDGIPQYDPFFSSFDLKTIPSSEIREIKITKGASSVLYGPNTLGGVVNIITRRPISPSISMDMQFDTNGSLDLKSSGTLMWDNFVISGVSVISGSKGFKWWNDGKLVRRTNSDYRRYNIMGKLRYYPSERSELLFEVSSYFSEFGVPSAVSYYKPRYWKFRNWNRFQVNFGGSFPLFKEGSLKVRSYYVRYFNILDSYREFDLTRLDWSSVHKNNSIGGFIIGDVPLSSNMGIKLSLNVRDDRARIQDDVGEPWMEYAHRTLSAGLEGHWKVLRNWKLVLGSSLDYLNKEVGNNKFTVNPILGLTRSLGEALELRLSFSQKSRFPSMRALYSTGLGNPFLRDERGTNLELGFRYTKGLQVSGAVFSNRVKDLINAVRLEDGSRTNVNVGRARIIGFELGVEKNSDRLNLSVNYTFLAARNLDEDRPLDLIPKSQFNFFLDVAVLESLKLLKGVDISFWGLAASRAEVNVFGDIVRIPGYVVLNSLFSIRISDSSLYIKIENLLGAKYVTEPGYPMKSRTYSFGFKFTL